MLSGSVILRWFSFSEQCVNQLTLQRYKEAHRHGVVISKAHCADRQFHAHFLAAFVRHQTGALRPMIDVMDSELPRQLNQLLTFGVG